MIGCTVRDTKDHLFDQDGTAVGQQCINIGERS
jgi:hypothetical protein